MTECGANKIVNWGILGCANIARKNVRAIDLSDNSTLIAVASRSLAKARSFISDNRLSCSVLAYGSYEELLANPEVHAVYIPLPTALHLEWAVKAALAKKHVLLEKPTTVTAESLRTIIEVCSTNNVFFMDGVMFMHHSRTNMLRRQLRDPFFPEVRKVQCGFSFHANEDFLKTNIRVSEDADPLGALGDLGWYCVRLGLIAFSEGRDTLGHIARPTSCIATCAHWNGNVPLDCEVRLSFGDASDKWSRLLVFDCSFLLPHRQWYEVLAASQHAQQDGVSDKLINCADFVLPRSSTVASFDMVTLPDACMVDHFSRAASALETFSVQHCVQEAEMFNCFSSYVIESQGGAKVIGQPFRDYWQQMALVTQLVMDAAMASMKTNGQEVEITY